MAKRIELNIPLNRVEGDLDIHVTLEDGVIVDAKSIGTLYRGFENILKERAALDALVITPRICGICSITHLCAAADALENAIGVTPPPQAVRLRNLSLLSETIQSDIRQFFLMYMGDFTNHFYKDAPFFDEANRFYKPFQGSAAKEALRQSATIVKVIAIIGGQWPHTSHIVPGGISTIPSLMELTMAQNYIEEVINWYEKHVIGASLDAFLQIKSVESFEAHLQNHPDTDLARFTKYAEYAKLFETGKTSQNFLSYGTINDPSDPKKRLIEPGVIIEGKYERLNISNIYEDISHSWFKQVDIKQDPFNGVTQPDMDNTDGYTWAKAPRYANNVMQTGPLAQALVDKEKLITSLNAKYGDCAYVRELARILRPARYLQYARRDIADALRCFGDQTYIQVDEHISGDGVGLIEAARGALGHWVRLKHGKIQNYQIITPTAWNGSPRDAEGRRGAWENALIGLECKDPKNPVEMGHVIRSFDPCLVCTVHAIDIKKENSQFHFKIGL